MDAERWERVAALFHEACERPLAVRKAFLVESCPDDEELRREVESLLSQDLSVHGPIERVAQQTAAWSSTVPGAERLPHSIGPYRIRRLVGEGGMGAVYEAEQDNPHRTVALKVVRSVLAAPDLLRRFAQESDALGRLQHPGIARIYEAAAADTELGPQPYFAMEFIRGRTLLEYAGGRRLTARERVALIIKICEAIDHAHQHGIIHRDLKPGNILVDETGQPKILDFGVARVTDSEAGATRQTNIGELVGTLAYMSPEQVSADPEQVDARTDVYSLGVLLFEVLAGRLPYQVSRQLPDAVRAIREEDPSPLREIAGADRGDLETIVNKALEKDKTRRYSSAAELAGDLGRFLRDEPIRARPPTAIYQTRKFARRHKALVGGAAAVFLVLLAGIIVSAGQAIRANRERDRALRAEQIANAVNDFLQNDLLAQAGARAQASRSGASDPDLKVRTALDRAAERLGGKFASQPLVEAAIRRTIGLAYYDLNAFSQAQPQLERAANLRRRVLGLEHPDTLTSLDDLGVLYNYQGKYAQAESLLSQVVEARKRILGSTDASTLAAMADLALVISYEGNDARAARLLADLLAADQQVRGEEHPDTLSVLDNLATVYIRLSKYAESETLLRKEVGIDRRILGSGHPDTLNAIHNLAVVERAEGKYGEADKLFSEALDGRRRALGEDHWETQNTRFGLALSYRAQGRYTEAGQLLMRAAEALVRDLGPEHPLSLQVLYNLAGVYSLRRQYAKAELLYNQVLEARRRVFGPDNLYTAEVLASLGEMKLDQRAYDQAEIFLREAVRVRRAKEPDSWQRYYTESMLGAALAGLKRSPEAETLVSSGYQGMVERQNSIPAGNRGELERAGHWRDQLSHP